MVDEEGTILRLCRPCLSGMQNKVQVWLVSAGKFRQSGLNAFSFKFATS